VNALQRVRRETALSKPTPWTARVWREYRAGNLTRACRDVLLVLPTFNGRLGLIPSHAAIAGRARCNVKTVQRALAAGRTLGLVSWIARRIRSGWRVLRTSNAYKLTTPETAVIQGARTNGLKAARILRIRESLRLQDSEAVLRRQNAPLLAAMQAVAAAGTDLLAARRRLWGQ
jgi:hypothetical protein